MEFKVVVLGDKGVGKTSLAFRYVEGTYNNKYQPTIGAFFLTKRVNHNHAGVGDGTYKLQLWDTAGQERFRAMAPMYYRNAAAAIVCYDITNNSTFTQMKDWIKELQQHYEAGEIVLAIVGNKCDLAAQRVITVEKGQEFAAECNALFFETSAKNELGVDDLFLSVGDAMLEKRKAQVVAPLINNNNNNSNNYSRSRSLVHNNNNNNDDGGTSGKPPCC